MITTKFLKSAGIVTLGAILSRVMGFGRETALASRFGAGAAVDAFQNASLIPVTLFLPVAGSLTSALIPTYARRLAQGGREAALRTANTLINLTLLGSLALALVLYALAPAVSAAVAPGFGPEGRDLVASLTRWMAPAMVFLGMATVITGILQAEERFTAPALAGIPMNGLLIALILGLSATAGVTAAAAGTLAGAAAYLAVHVWGLRGSGYRYRFVLDLRDPGLGLIGRMIGPLVLTTAAAQLTLYLNRVLASGLPEGSISYLNFGTRVAELPLTIFAAALTTVIYPVLSNQATAGETAFDRSLQGGVRMMLYITAPMAVGMALLREPIVRLLFERGAFDATDTMGTATAILYLTVGLVPAAVASVWGKGFYALGDTRSPFLAALAAMGAVLAFSLLLIRPMGHTGLALAMSLAQVTSFLTTGLLLRRRAVAIGGWPFARHALRVGAACLVMAVAVIALHTLLSRTGLLVGAGLLAQAARLAVLSGWGAAVYVLSSSLLGLEEVTLLRQAAVKAWGRLLPGSTSPARP